MLSLKNPPCLLLGTYCAHIDCVITVLPFLDLAWTSRLHTSVLRYNNLTAACSAFKLKVDCIFGAVFSAHFWSLGGYLLRLFHFLTWLAHAGFLYVDDLFMLQDAKVMPISASMIALLCQICCIPVSWKKCELGQDITVTWIGWRWQISAGVVSIPHARMKKLQALIHKLHGCEKTSKKYVEQFLGLAIGITQLFPSMRTWLHSLYRGLHAIPVTQCSVDPSQWNLAVNCLSDTLVFEKRPAGSAIPIGGR